MFTFWYHIIMFINPCHIMVLLFENIIAFIVFLFTENMYLTNVFIICIAFNLMFMHKCLFLMVSCTCILFEYVGAFVCFCEYILCIYRLYIYKIKKSIIIKNNMNNLFFALRTKLLWARMETDIDSFNFSEF